MKQKLISIEIHESECDLVQRRIRREEVPVSGDDMLEHLAECAECEKVFEQETTSTVSDLQDVVTQTVEAYLQDGDAGLEKLGVPRDFWEAIKDRATRTKEKK